LTTDERFEGKAGSTDGKNNALLGRMSPQDASSFRGKSLCRVRIVWLHEIDHVMAYAGPIGQRCLCRTNVHVPVDLARVS